VSGSEGREGPASRRSLLLSLGVGLAAVLGAAGCGNAQREPGVRLNRRTRGAGADAHTLNQLLAAEYYAIAAYTAATPLLTGTPARVARRFLGHEVLHADRLISLIQRAGGQARQAPASHDLGHPTTASEIMRLLLKAERAQLTAYLEAAPTLSPGSLKAMAASIFATQAQHAAVWRLQLGQMPAPTALVTGHE